MPSTLRTLIVLFLPGIYWRRRQTTGYGMNLRATHRSIAVGLNGNYLTVILLLLLCHGVPASRCPSVVVGGQPAYSVTGFMVRMPEEGRGCSQALIVLFLPGIYCRRRRTTGGWALQANAAFRRIALGLNGNYLTVILPTLMVWGPKKDDRIAHSTNGQSTENVTRSCSSRFSTRCTPQWRCARRLSRPPAPRCSP